VRAKTGGAAAGDINFIPLDDLPPYQDLLQKLKPPPCSRLNFARMKESIKKLKPDCLWKNLIALCPVPSRATLQSGMVDDFIFQPASTGAEIFSPIRIRIYSAR